MKKRLLSALLALALVFVLLPTTALADTPPETDDNVKINGTPVTVGNDISLGDGNGTYSYDKSTRTLTLNNATITATGSNIGIDFCDTTNYVTYSVILTGENTVTSNKIAIETTPNTNLTFTGGGNLKAITNGYYQAIRVYGTLTIDNSTLIAESSADTATTVIWTLAMTGDNAKLEISNKRAANIVAGTAGPASKNIDWSNYQFTTGSYSGDALTESDPEVCSWGTLNEYLGFPTKKYSQYICIAKRTTPAPTKTSDVLIAGKDAVVGVETSIPSANGSGTYFYDQASKTLTLKDVNIASSSIINGIQFTKEGTYTINLVGTNTMSGFSTGISANSADQYVSNINITITGAGSLEVSTTSYAIAMNKGNLKFENTGEIKLTTSNISKKYNVLSVSGNITIADMEKYKVEGIVQDNTKDGGDTVTLSEASHLKGYKNPDGTAICLKTITITPAAAKPSTISYDGTTLKQGETIYGETSGTATVAAKGNTITLDNFKGNYPLEFNAEFTPNSITLIGDSTLSAVETKYQNLTISGSGSLTVGSIRVTNNDNISADLTITGGAHVTVNRPSSEDKPAVEVSGNLTVTGEGTQLSAECTAATNPAIEVGGNVTISGNPGINAYTVKAYNKYATQRGRDDKLRPSQMPSAFEISGNLSISGSAQVMAKTDSDGAAVWMPKEKVISVVDASLIAQNSSHNFSTISFGDENNMGNIYAKGQEVNIVAENMLHRNIRLAHRSIKAFIYNHYNTGDSNPYYIKVVSEGVQSGGNVNVIPGHCTSTGGYKVTITRGDAYTTPQVAANYTIAGQTMYVGKYYKTDANGNITDGTAQDYNIYCDSENDFTLNNATISSTGTGGSTGVIMTNLNASSNEIHIKLIGTNSINTAGHHAILGEGAYSTIFIENAENASNASLTISGNYLPVYSYGNVTINAEVVIKNTNGNLISTNKDGHANGAFDLGSGYKCYASTSTTGNLLEEFNSANYSTYKYLRVTTLTLETGGGSTHQHVWDEAWHDTGDYHHAHQCTICKAYDTTTQELHNVTGHRDNHDGSHSNICGSCGYSAKVSHSYTWAPNANDNEKHIGTCVCGNVVEKNHNFVGDVCSDCGYDKSTGTTCEHVWTTEWTIDTVDNEYHWHKCIKCNAITDKKPHAYTIVTDSGTNHIRECECKVFYVEDHISSDWIIDTPATATTAGSMHKECTVCKHKMQTEVIPATGEIVPPTPDNPGTIVIIRPAEEEKPAQQPNPSTGANDLVGLAVAAAVAAALGSAALLRKHD